MQADRYRTEFGNNVAVIGASSKKERDSNKAVRALVEAGYNPYPVHPKEQLIEGRPVARSVSDISDPIDFVSIYVNPKIALDSGLPEQLMWKHVKGAILNPGTRDETLVEKLEEWGIIVLQECTIADGMGRDPSQL